MSDTTRVVFRTWKDDGSVIALFPDLAVGGGCCESYQHVGQHGGADYGHVVSKSRPSTPAEYMALKMELARAPYNYKLRVVKRR
jgi:hypothetical protein